MARLWVGSLVKWPDILAYILGTSQNIVAGILVSAWGKRKAIKILLQHAENAKISGDIEIHGRVED